MRDSGGWDKVDTTSSAVEEAEAEEAARDAQPTTSPSPGSSSFLQILWVALRLGLTSFGGPVAHLGYFREEYVLRRRWLDEHTYADLVALCQFLPGPASSQVGIGVGILRGGLPGGLAAWLGFTLPSAIALTAFAYFVGNVDVAGAAWLHGLKVVAVAVVAQAVWGMSRQFCTDRARTTIAVLAALAILATPSAVGQLVVIGLAGVVGWRLFPGGDGPAPPAVHIPLSKRAGAVAWAIFFGLLVVLPLVRLATTTTTTAATGTGAATWSGSIALFDSFYRVGSLVFGGGHVVLPLLQAEVVPPGWLTNSQFIAGYGAAQAVPGPLFTFSAYLGAVRSPQPNGALGAAVALAAIFLPAFLLVIGSLPFWGMLRQHPRFKSALSGINAAVVGILLAALYNPVWTSAILGPADFGLAVACLGLLMIWKLPPWTVVLFASLGGLVLSAFA